MKLIDPMAFKPLLCAECLPKFEKPQVEVEFCKKCFAALAAFAAEFGAEVDEQ